MSLMAAGNSRVPQANINVTPLIDVLLTLLVIFMIILPIKPKGLMTEVPQKPDPKHSTQISDEQSVVLQIFYVEPGSVSLRINQQEVSQADLGERLKDIFKARADKVLFLKGDNNLPFAEVAWALDVAHNADSSIRIGLMPGEKSGD